MKILCGLLMGMLLSCTPYKPEFIHDSFTFSEIHKSKILIGGVMDVTVIGDKICDADPAKCSIYWSMIAYKEMKNNRDDLQFFHPSFALKVLGKEAYAEIIETFSETNDLSAEQLDLLSSKLEFDYVVFATILKNETGKDIDDRRDEEKKETAREYRADRDIEGSFKIYDLRKKMVVWIGSKSAERRASNRVVIKDPPPPEPDKPIKNGWELAAALLSGPDKKDATPEVTYPTPPSIVDTMQTLFSDVAGVLPEKN